MNIANMKGLLKWPQFNRAFIWLISLLRWFKVRYFIVRMDTNHICNLSCRMCYFNSSKERFSREISEPLFNKIAQEIFPKTRILYLSCYAEPFCSKNIFDYIAIAKIKYKVPLVSLTTNGILLTSANSEKLIESGIDEIAFSLSGGCRETYEYFQVGASWDILWGNIKHLASIKVERNKSNPRICVNYILNRKSVKEVSLVAPLFKQYGVQTVNLRELIPFRNIGWDFYQENCIESLHEESIKCIYTILKSHGINVVSSLQCNTSKIPVSKKYPCLIPYISVFINSGAYIKFCIFRDWEFSLEKLTFKEILSSEPHQSFLNTLKKKATAHCLSNCPMFAFDKELAP